VDVDTVYRLLKIRYAFVKCLKKIIANCLRRNEVHSNRNFFSKGSEAFLCPRSLSTLTKFPKMFILNRINYCFILIIHIYI